MSSRLYSGRIVAIRPVLGGLESRELLSQIAIPDKAKARIATISELPTAPSQAVSTVPANGDLNPYGVAFVPRAFAGGGCSGRGMPWCRTSTTAATWRARARRSCDRAGRPAINQVEYPLRRLDGG